MSYLLRLIPTLWVGLAVGWAAETLAASVDSEDFVLSAFNNNMPAVQQYIKDGGDVNKTYLGASALQVAAMEANEDMVKLLLRVGANRNYVGLIPGQPFAVRAITAARFELEVHPAKDPATSSRLQRIIALLGEEKGDSLSDPEVLREKFFVAVYHDDLKAVTECIKEGVDINKPATQGGLSALHFAAMGGSEDIVKLLLRSSANPSYVGSRPSQNGTSISITAAVGAQAKAATAYSPEMKEKFERIAQILADAEKSK